jgi:uncharacterized RDD family membrane protein YckC
MGRRIGAFFIDWVPVFVLFLVLFNDSVTRFTNAPDGFCDGIEANSDDYCFESGDDAYVAAPDDLALPFLIPAGVGLVNVVLVEGLTGGTVGKLLVHLRVVREDGRRAGLGRVALRALLLYVAFALSLFLLVGVIVELIVACATKPHRRIGDMAAGTYVVPQSRVGTPVKQPPAASPYWTPAPQPWGQQPAPSWGQPPGWSQQPPGWNPPPAGWDTPAPPAPDPAAAPGPDPAAAPGPDPAAAPGPVSAGGPGGPGAGPNAWTPASPTAPIPAPGPATWQPGPPPQQSTAPPQPGEVAPPAQPVQQAPPSAERSQPPAPQWDLQLKAWITWDANRGQWLQWDETAAEWRPMR